MVLSVHILVGGAIAKAFHLSPAGAVVAGFASHFLLDAIPHADYPLRSLEKDGADRKNDAMSKDWRLAHDLVVNGLDGTLGLLVLSLVVLRSGSITAPITGALAACMPDALQFLHFMFPKVKPLAWFKRFHGFFHTPLAVETYFKQRPALAVLVQALVAVGALYSIVGTALAF